MKFPPESITTFLRLLRRDGFVSVLKCARYAASPSAWRWLLGGGLFPLEKKDIALVRSSKWFDAKWYLENQQEVLGSDVDPATHYVRNGLDPVLNPGPDFVGAEYLSLNPDVMMAKMNPLVHFERDGLNQNRQMSYLEIPPETFPVGAVETRAEFKGGSGVHRRLAIFAAFCGKGRIPETTLFYLRGLREVADQIVFVSNSPVFPDEVRKLDGLVRIAVFRHHGEYDFGSYKIGFDEALRAGFLAPEATDELILANDSCYGPVVPFQGTFQTMAPRQCDFWGLTAFEGFGIEHIQSFFLVFRRRVLDGPELSRFLASVHREPNRWWVIIHYETRLTKVLADAGYRFDTLVPWNFFRDRASAKKFAFPPARPATLLSKYRMPLIKVKTVKGENDEDPGEIESLVRKIVPELAEHIPWSAHGSNALDHAKVREARLNHAKSLEATIARIRARAGSGKAVSVKFLVFSPSDFPAGPLLSAMLSNPRFDARIVVIPDLRRADWQSRQSACASQISEAFPECRVESATRDESGEWPDLLESADIVCYPSPDDVSDFRYNPHWAVGRSFLPIHVSHGFSDSEPNRNAMKRQNYAYFWKVFFSDREAFDSYAEHSARKGENAVLAEEGDIASAFMSDIMKNLPLATNAALSSN